MAKKRTYSIASMHTVVDEGYSTKAAAVKARNKIVREEAARCRARYKRCSVVKASNTVKIHIGGRQGYNLWNSYTVNERTGLGRARRRK